MVLFFYCVYVHNSLIAGPKNWAHNLDKPLFGTLWQCNQLLVYGTMTLLSYQHTYIFFGLRHVHLIRVWFY